MKDINKDSQCTCMLPRSIVFLTQVQVQLLRFRIDQIKFENLNSLQY